MYFNVQEKGGKKKRWNRVEGFLQFPRSAASVILVKPEYSSLDECMLYQHELRKLFFFFFFNRVIRSSVANGDESGPSCGHNLWCLTASPCSSLFCCADSFYSFGHGGAFCFSPCYTTSLVGFNSSFFNYFTPVYAVCFSRIWGQNIRGP